MTSKEEKRYVFIHELGSFSDTYFNEHKLIRNGKYSCSYDDFYQEIVLTLDYGGWKWQEADLSILPEGVEYQLMGIRVVRREGLLSGSGSVYLNDLRYEYNPQTGVEQTDADVPTIAPQKHLRDGHLYIIRDGKTYDAEGIQLQ